MEHLHRASSGIQPLVGTSVRKIPSENMVFHDAKNILIPSADCIITYNLMRTVFLGSKIILSAGQN